jgi:hypothetical protein
MYGQAGAGNFGGRARPVPLSSRTMGKRALEVKRLTVRRIRADALTVEERAVLKASAAYQGSPHHKRNPGDFGLIPPAAPRADKTLCDEASVFKRVTAEELFELAVTCGLASEATAANGMPKQLWVVDGSGNVFEAMYGGAVTGCYHGYPIRRSDPFFEQAIRAWDRR